MLLYKVTNDFTGYLPQIKHLYFFYFQAHISLHQAFKRGSSGSGLEELPAAQFKNNLRTRNGRFLVD